MRTLDYTPMVLIKLREEIERFCKENENYEQCDYNEELLNDIKQTLKNLFPQVCSYTFGSEYLGLPYIPKDEEEYDMMIDSIEFIEKRVRDKMFFKHDTYIFYTYNENYETSDEFYEYADKVLQLDHDWFDDPSFYYRLTNALHKILLDEEIDRIEGKLSKLERQIEEAQHIISSYKGDMDGLCKERNLLK